MQITFTQNYLEASQENYSNRDLVDQIIKESHVKMRGYFTDQIDVRMSVDANPYAIIPELGIGGGYENDKQLITLSIDMTHPVMASDLQNQLCRCFAHEYMHAYREEEIPWDGCTLLEAFVAEGLTQNFELEFTNKTIPPVYATSLSPDEREKYWQQAQSELEHTDFDYSAWFFGSEEKGMPKWIGYNIGFWLVKKYLEQNDKVPSEIAHLSAHTLLIR